MVKGINHVTLSVVDLDRSLHFYTDILGMRPLARWYSGAYLLAGDDWVCLAVDSRRRASALPEYTHLALTVSQNDFDSAVDRLNSSGAPRWQFNRSPGDSIYFLDPDRHKLEIHVSSWQERLEHMTTNPPKGFKLLSGL